jgi:hypothetical protein
MKPSPQNASWHIESVRQAWSQHEHDARLEDEIATLRGEASIEIADPELAGANAAP